MTISEMLNKIGDSWSHEGFSKTYTIEGDDVYSVQIEQEGDPLARFVVQMVVNEYKFNPYAPEEGTLRFLQEAIQDLLAATTVVEPSARERQYARSLRNPYASPDHPETLALQRSTGVMRIGVVDPWELMP